MIPLQLFLIPCQIQKDLFYINTFVIDFITVITDLVIMTAHYACVY